jgi:indolepyruvate ferredoxin oxidoreductase beta subunit
LPERKKRINRERKMKYDIILAGVGGQGILSIATVFGYAAVESGLYLKQAEVHGMSQRGGDVQSHLRISDKEIFSDLVPFGRADLIVSVEPMESLRYLPYLSSNGWIVSNTTAYDNIVDYPEIKNVITEIKQHKNHILLDANAVAKEMKNPRGMNMVVAGAASAFM